VEGGLVTCPYPLGGRRRVEGTGGRPEKLSNVVAVTLPSDNTRCSARLVTRYLASGVHPVIDLTAASVGMLYATTGSCGQLVSIRAGITFRHDRRRDDETSEEKLLEVDVTD
jgi:hypothetical protein